MAPILEVHNLQKTFPGFILDHVSFSLEPGFIMGFIGPNGAGKTTTIKLILNLINKDGGEIKVFGLDHIQKEREIKNKIGFVFSENHYYDELTLGEIKRVVVALYQDWEEDTFQRYLRDFSLPLNKKVGEFSSGMKMKMSLAFALSHKAQLLVLDEPTSGLDPIVRQELLTVLRDVVAEEDKSVFFSTHITSDLDRVADYITFIHEGAIILSSPKDDLVENYGLVKGPRELLTEAAQRHFIGWKENQYGFEGLMADKTLAGEIFGDSVIIERPDLEAIMLYYTRGNGCA